MACGATDRQHGRRPGTTRGGRRRGGLPDARPIFLTTALLAGLVAIAAATPARASAVDLLFGVGREQGAFLGDADVDLDEVFITSEFGGPTSKLSFTLPYVRMNRTGLVTMTPEGPVVIGAGGPGRPPWQDSDPDSGESGIGDVLVQSKNYILKSGPGNRPTLTFDVDYKFSTADESKGLGTGKDDYSAGLDYVQPIGKRLQILGRATYRFTGSPDGFDFQDRLYLSAGFGVMTAHSAWRLHYETVNPILKEVVQYDASGAAVAFVPVEDYKAVRGEAVIRNNAGGSVKIWALAGLNDSSPDLGFGLTFSSRGL